MSEEQPIGHVSHYFGKISVAALELYGTVRVGDWLQQNFSTIAPYTVEEAYEGQSIGVQVDFKVRVVDYVYLVPPPE